MMRDNKVNDDPQDTDSGVPSEIEGVLERVEEKDPESATVIKEYLAVQQTSHRGPMPSPDDLQKYSLVQKDLPERMMRMAEASLENKSRHNDKILELKDKEIQLKNFEVSKDDAAHVRETHSHYITLAAAFTIVVICIIGSFYMATQGHKDVALLVGGTTVVGIVVAFFKGKNRGSKE